jgi:hypothetical protein
MNTYGIALFVHIVGLIALFSALVLLQRGVVRLRTASTWEEARVWLGMVRPVGGMFLFGTLTLLATGLYMARLEWTSDAPWVVVGEIVAVAFAVVGGIVAAAVARMSRIARRHAGEVADEDQEVLRAPAIWAPVFAMNGAAMGVVWLMTTKPGWGVSIALPMLLTLAGAVAGMNVSKAKKPYTSGWEPIPSLRERHAG